jgi:hypothetical protein
MELWLKPRNEHPAARDLMLAYQNHLEKLLGFDTVSPGLAITTIANLNFHGEHVPANFFRQIDYSRLRNPSTHRNLEDAVILAKVLHTVKDGMTSLDPPERIDVGPYQMQYNFIRGFRPKGAAGAKSAPLNHPINQEKDYLLTNPDFDHETFYEFDAGGFHWECILNRYPFAPYHFLLVPDKDKLHNQYLDPDKDAGIVRCVDEIARRRFGPDLRIGYNAHGAHASINHLHFQGFFVTDDWNLPVDASDVRGDVNYLLECLGGTNHHAARGEDVRYNLYFDPKGLVIFPRKSQSSPEYVGRLSDSPFTTGYAFFEMCGEIICPDRDVFNQFKDRPDPAPLKALFHAARLSPCLTLS